MRSKKLTFYGGLTGLALCTMIVGQSLASAVPVYQYPYVEIDTEVDYLANYHPNLAYLGGYFAKQPNANVGNALQDYINVKSNYYTLQHTNRITSDDFIDDSNANFKNCYDYPLDSQAKNVDSDVKVCPVTITDGSTTITQPVLVNNGLRAQTITALVNMHVSRATEGTVGRDYFEIAAKPGDSINIPLGEYVMCGACRVGENSVTTGVNFYFDNALVAGQSVNDVAPRADKPGSVVRIQGINNVSTDSNHKNFGLTINNANQPTPSLTGKLTQPGLYQVNLVAVRDKDSKGHDLSVKPEKVYVTFYISVNDDEVSFSDWMSGGHTGTPRHNYLRTFNGDEPLALVYTYAHQNLVQQTKKYYAQYRSYASDLNYVNNASIPNTGERIPQSAPLNVMSLESGGPAYATDAQGKAVAYWKINNPTWDLKASITPDAVINSDVLKGQKTAISWIFGVINNIQVPGAKHPFLLAPDLTFGHNLRAGFVEYNQQQMDILSNLILQNYIGTNYTSTAPDHAGNVLQSTAGLSLDLEQGTSVGWGSFMKMMADKLAYTGKFFGYYEFADKAFQPAVVAAMGPLGVGLISTYDVGGGGSTGVRAPEEYYISQGMPKAMADILYTKTATDTVPLGAFWANKSCYVAATNPVGNQVGRASWCGLTTTDSKFVNSAAWSTVADSPNHYMMSTQAVYQAFNAHYAPVMPMAEGSTEFSMQEVINPDFSNYVLPKGVTVKHNVVMPEGGSVLSNPNVGNSGSYGDARVVCSNAWLHDHSDEIITTIDYCRDNYMGKLVNFADKCATYSTTAPNTGAYKLLSQCLFAGQTYNFNSVSEGQSLGRPMVNFVTDCGIDQNNRPIPADKCLMIYGTPAYNKGIGISSPILTLPNQGLFLYNNNQPYLQADGSLDPNLAGYAYFAMQNDLAGPNEGAFWVTPVPSSANKWDGFVNLTVQEPWYVGGQALRCVFNDNCTPWIQIDNSFDPFNYQIALSKHRFLPLVRAAWLGVMYLQNQFNDTSNVTTVPGSMLLSLSQIEKPNQ